MKLMEMIGNIKPGRQINRSVFIPELNYRNNGRHQDEDDPGGREEVTPVRPGQDEGGEGEEGGDVPDAREGVEKDLPI